MGIRNISIIRGGNNCQHLNKQLFRLLCRIRRSSFCGKAPHKFHIFSGIVDAGNPLHPKPFRKTDEIRIRRDIRNLSRTDIKRIHRPANPADQISILLHQLHVYRNREFDFPIGRRNSFFLKLRSDHLKQGVILCFQQIGQCKRQNRRNVFILIEHNRHIAVNGIEEF